MNKDQTSASQITLRAITPADSATLRSVRLRALLDSPLAFASTHAKESAQTESEWRAKAQRWTEPGFSSTFLAFDGTECCGIVACFKDRQVQGRVWVASMWVAPEARRKGVGWRLLASVDQWAVEQAATEIALDVTEGSTPAIEFYQRCGFGFTGETSPHTHVPNLQELRMIKTLRPL